MHGDHIKPWRRQKDRSRELAYAVQGLQFEEIGAGIIEYIGKFPCNSTVVVV